MGGQTVSTPMALPSAEDLGPVAAVTAGLVLVGFVDTVCAGFMRTYTGIRSPRMDGPPCFLRS